MRILLAIVLAAHAIAHLPEFLGSWHILNGPDLPYRTTVFGGRVNVGSKGMRVIGLLWLLAGLGVGLAAVYVFRNTSNWFAITWAAVGFSALMSLAGLPDSRTGVALNALVMAFLVWASSAR